jgi:hypothetical protein
MTQQRKNILLLVSLVVLVVLCVVAANYNPYKKTSSITQKDVFAIANPAERLTKVVINGPDVSNTLELKNAAWSVNNKYKLDPAMQQVLMALLERVEVQREISGDLKKEIIQIAADTGIQVQIYADKQQLRDFKVVGNPSQIASYFVNNDKVYQMQLPGYESYVAGMFEVKTLDWRDRTIFNGTWQDIVSLTLECPDGDSLIFKYDKGLIKLQNRANTDSVKVMDYIETYNYFFVDQFLPENHEAVQMVSEFASAGKIRIQALDKNRNLKLDFFSHPNFNAILVKINDREWAGIQKARYNKYFPNSVQFLK